METPTVQVSMLKNRFFFVTDSAEKLAVDYKHKIIWRIPKCRAFQLLPSQVGSCPYLQILDHKSFSKHERSRLAQSLSKCGTFQVLPSQVGSCPYLRILGQEKVFKIQTLQVSTMPTQVWHFFRCSPLRQTPLLIYKYQTIKRFSEYERSRLAQSLPKCGTFRVLPLRQAPVLIYKYQTIKRFSEYECSRLAQSLPR